MCLSMGPGSGLDTWSADASPRADAGGVTRTLRQWTAASYRHNTWFGSSDARIWLYTPTKGLVKVASIPPRPGGSRSPYDDHGWRTIAGPCA